MTARPMLELQDVTKRFGTVEAVAGITFSVREGEIVGFLGPNGAGKTTTMRILAGIFPPTSGEVRVAGHDPLREPLACRRAVGYFPEYAPFYPELSVAGYLRLVTRLKRLPPGSRGGAVAREDYAAAKPAPDAYLGAAAALGLAPRACVAVEDTPRGLAAARAAGMRVVAVPGELTADQNFDGAWRRLPSLDALDAALLGATGAPA